MDRHLVYFASDVHLGLQALDPADRERRFVEFLRGIPRSSAQALYLLGDIWDFWYEWKYTVPKGYVRVLSQLVDLVDSGVKVYFFQGNHDVWMYRYFEELGMVPLVQPFYAEIGARTFCLGHGDALGKTTCSYRFMRWVFHNRVCQRLFSTLVHPTVAMSIGNRWSRNNRLSRRGSYEWKGLQDPLAVWAQNSLAARHADYFIFGHLHLSAIERLEGGATLAILDSWLYRNSAMVYDLSEDRLKTVE